MTENKQLNIILLDSYLETLGVSVLLKMLDLYIKQSEIYLRDIEKVISLDNHELWQKSCHKMKGAAGSTGLLDVHKKLVVMERSLSSIEQKKAYLAELELLNKTGIDNLKIWLN